MVGETLLESILGGATGGAAVAILAAVFFFKALVEKVVEGAGRRFESKLRQMETVQKSILATASIVDTDLRNRRIQVYTELWRMTGVLPQWPHNAELTYENLSALTGELRKWYFDQGGMYLSDPARTAYGCVQESLDAVLSQRKGEKVSADDYEKIRQQCSKLRSELTNDLLSRREAPQIPHARID